jgi:dolichol-phosphate mannosyltransferase
MSYIAKDEIRLLVILPVYNEEKNIDKQLTILNESIREFTNSYKILIIDDGSKDRTPQMLINNRKIYNNLIYIRNSIHKGIGEVLRQGLLVGIQLNPVPEYIVTIEADNSCDVNLIPKMIFLNKNGYDVVIASRYLNGGASLRFPWIRKILSIFVNIILRFLFKFDNVHDYTILYRAYKGKIIENLIKRYGRNFIFFKGFASVPESLIKLKTLNIKITEIPHIYNYNRRRDRSKMKILPTIIEYIIFIGRSLKYAKL